jgi:hypothetical protein
MRHRARDTRSRTTAARLEAASLVDTGLAVVIAMLLSWLIFAV